MPKAEWGKKIVCPECNTKFYDLNKKYPVECPGCGVFIALNEMLQYGSDAKKVYDDNLDAEEIGNLVGDDATESMSDVDILEDESETIDDEEIIKRLESCKKYISVEMNLLVDLKFMPKLIFRNDEQILNYKKINELLNSKKVQEDLKK